MGLTVFYRGRLADPTRIEDFEDRVLDFALEVGGMAQIWRSRASEHTERMVRGVILHLTPGQDSTSLLIAPEGWLIGLADIEDAEDGRLSEPPWCFTKTQFGTLEGHVALIEMLRALGEHFLTDLEVNDEGGYWETTDLAELIRRRDLLQGAIDSLAAGLKQHGLSSEAAEDPEILCKRIERIAAQVHRILRRPAEHAPVTFPEDEDCAPPDPEQTEALWDEMYKHNRRRQERFERALEERRNAGEDDETAFEGAMKELGLDVPRANDEDSEGGWKEDDSDVEFADLDDDADTGDESALDADDAASDDNSDVFERRRRDRHPLVERATEMYTSFHDKFRDADPKLEQALSTLFQGAGDMVGGLVQALSSHGDEEVDLNFYGLRVVQFKRALRGAAFAGGALFLLKPALTGADFENMHGTVAQLQKDIFQELARLRSEYPRNASEAD